MARLIKLSFPALRLGKTSFWRCGVEHGRDGAVYAEGQFTAAEWDRLRSDPMLEVIEVPDDVAPVPTPEEAAADLRARIRAAIAGLSADEYTKGGAPQLGAIRNVVPEAGSETLKTVLAEVWAEMTAQGFRRPGDVPPAAPAPATTGNSEPAPVTGETEPAPGTTGATDTAPVSGAPEPVPSAGAAQDDAGAPEEA